MPYVRLVALPLAVALAATRCPSPTVRASEVATSPPSSPSSRPERAPHDEGRLALGRFGGTPPFAYYSGIADSLRLVVRDAESWRAQWDALNREMRPQPPLPTVDFAREMVVIAALGARGSGGWSIVVDSAVWRGGTTAIYLRRLAPGRGCFTTAAVSSPVDVVRVPRSDAPVRFVERLVREDCD